MRGLELDRVGRRYGPAQQARIVLHDLTLRVEPGELVCIWGLRRSGRTTLLRVAAGIEPPDSGSVRYDGQNLARRQALGRQIGWCQRQPRGVERNASVLEELTHPQLARGSTREKAETRARAALEQTGASDYREERLCELDAGQQTRVALARTLTLGPSLLIFDDPLTGVELLERDPILALLRALANQGTAILTSTGDAACLAGADRALTLSHGQLHGHTTPRRAQVLTLRPRHRAA